MKRASVTEVKNRFSHFLRLVKQGETIEILERSLPVARLEGIAGASAGGDDQRKRLVRDGIITPPRKPPPKLKGSPLPCKVDPAQVLIEERGDR